MCPYVDGVLVLISSDFFPHVCSSSAYLIRALLPRLNTNARHTFQPHKLETRWVVFLLLHSSALLCVGQNTLKVCCCVVTTREKLRRVSKLLQDNKLATFRGRNICAALSGALLFSFPMSKQSGFTLLQRCLLKLPVQPSGVSILNFETGMSLTDGSHDFFSFIQNVSVSVSCLSCVEL